MRMSTQDLLKALDQVKVRLLEADASDALLDEVRKLLGGPSIVHLNARSTNLRVRTKVLELLDKNKDGMRVGELVDAGAGTRAQVIRALQALRLEKSTYVQGHKRLAKWFAGAESSTTKKAS